MSSRDVHRNSLQYQMTDIKITDLKKLELIKELYKNDEVIILF